MSKKKVKTKFNIKSIFNYIKKNMLFFIFVVLFIILTTMIFTGLTNKIDENITSYIIGIRNDNLTNTMINISNIGGAYSLIVISLLLLICIKKKKIPLLIIVNLVIVFFTSQIFKLIFRRPRPDGLYLISERGFSYPSGHAMVSFAFISFIIYLLYKYLNNKLAKICISIALSIIILLIGFSRIYLGVHYLTDVLGGYLLGICYLLLYIKIIKGRNYI